MPALYLMNFMRSQWIQGPGGPTGLNYVAMFHKMDRMVSAGDIAPEDYDQLEDDIRLMEVAALNATHAKP